MHFVACGFFEGGTTAILAFGEASGHASAGVRDEAFSRQWQLWPARP